MSLRWYCVRVGFTQEDRIKSEKVRQQEGRDRVGGAIIGLVLDNYRQRPEFALPRIADIADRSAYSTRQVLRILARDPELREMPRQVEELLGPDLKLLGEHFDAPKPNLVTLLISPEHAHGFAEQSVRYLVSKWLEAVRARSSGEAADEIGTWTDRLSILLYGYLETSVHLADPELAGRAFDYVTWLLTNLGKLDESLMGALLVRLDDDHAPGRIWEYLGMVDGMSRRVGGHRSPFRLMIPEQDGLRAALRIIGAADDLAEGILGKLEAASKAIAVGHPSREGWANAYYALGMEKGAALVGDLESLHELRTTQTSDFLDPATGRVLFFRPEADLEIGRMLATCIFRIRRETQKTTVPQEARQAHSALAQALSALAQDNSDDSWPRVRDIFRVYQAWLEDDADEILRIAPLLSRGNFFWRNSRTERLDGWRSSEELIPIVHRAAMKAGHPALARLLEDAARKQLARYSVHSSLAPIRAELVQLATTPTVIPIASKNNASWNDVLVEIRTAVLLGEDLPPYVFDELKVIVDNHFKGPLIPPDGTIRIDDPQAFWKPAIGHTIFMPEYYPWRRDQDGKIT